jgi:hypothetical protein
VYRVRFTQAPLISQQPADVTVAPGTPATFAVTATGAGPLSYQWHRNGADIPGATGPTFTLANPQPADSGARFRVVVTNEFGRATSGEATLTVTGNQPPAPVITTPAAGTTFVAGQSVTATGTASDPEDGPLGPAALTWRVDYITGTAPPRPFVPDTAGVGSLTFTIPTVTPYTLPDVLYRISLTARDSAGATVTTTRDLAPVTAAVTLASTAAGTTLTLDGQPVTAPHTFTGVAGVERQIGAPATVTANGQTFTFTGWQDGPTANPRTISTPPAAATFTAVYTGPAVPPVPPPAPIAVGGGRQPPQARLLAPADGKQIALFDLNQVALGSPGFTGETRVATGDVNGDGTADLVVGAGPGGPSFVVVYDGKTKGVITTPTIFEPSFTGGVYVAAGDIDGDGKADVIVSPDEGGGPRVVVLSVQGGNATIANFFGIDDPNFRGGARVAAGDVTGDGRADIAVAAGFLGGPRVAVWDGKQLAAGKLARPFNDFFAFEETLRNGVFVAAGDVNGDAKADLILGGGPGGGPRVRVLAGADLLASNALTDLGNFFTGDDAIRDGVRVAAKDLNADGKADVVAGVAGRVRGYRGPGFPSAGTPTPDLDVPAFDDGSVGSVYVG